MNPVVAAMFFTALAGLSQQFFYADKPVTDEFIAAEVLNMFPDAWLAAVSMRSLLDPARGTKSVNPADSGGFWVLAAIDIAAATTGFGLPYRGDELEQSAGRYTALPERLECALPGGSWQGPAAQAYTAKIVELQNYSMQLAELDKRLENQAQDLADWVTHVRLGFGILKCLALLLHFLEETEGVLVYGEDTGIDYMVILYIIIFGLGLLLGLIGGKSHKVARRVRDAIDDFHGDNKAVRQAVGGSVASLSDLPLTGGAAPVVSGGFSFEIDAPAVGVLPK